MKKYKFLVLLFFIITSCSKDDKEVYVPIQKTIYDQIASSMNYSYLAYALEKTNLDDVLDGDDEFTLYAPNNTALVGYVMQAGYENFDDVPTATLKQILLNHVMVGQKEYRNFETGYFKTAASSDANEQSMSIFIKQVNMRVTLNGVSRIVQGNVRASNGIIHAVNAVIPVPSLVTFVQADPNLYNLAEALMRDDLTVDFPTILSTVNGTAPAPFTVFAPNNRAFLDLLDELEVDKLSSIDEPTLNATLNHHIVEEMNAVSTDLSDDLLLNTLGGG